jgi:hypothetical protein
MAKAPEPEPLEAEPEAISEVEPDLEETEVMLEPEESADSPLEVSTISAEPEPAGLLEDDTFSPPQITPGQMPMAPPELPPAPVATEDPAYQKIRQTLEATGDLKPKPTDPMAETFMVPPASLEEAKPAFEDLDALPDFDADDDDSLDLGSDSESMSFGDELLDDLDDE